MDTLGPKLPSLLPRSSPWVHINYLPLSLMAPRGPQGCQESHTDSFVNWSPIALVVTWYTFLLLPQQHPMAVGLESACGPKPLQHVSWTPWWPLAVLEAPHANGGCQE